MLIHFTKMHGLGNDFMVVDQISQKVRLRPEQVRRLSDRNLGVGFDQLLLVEPPTKPDADFSYRIFNADGSEVENSGNGARCFAMFVQEKRLTNKKTLRVETAGGPLLLTLNDNGQIMVDMGVPRLNPADLPFYAVEQAISYPLNISALNTDALKTAKQQLEIGAVSIGNPHAITRVEDVLNTAVNELGAAIESHPLFPKRVNAGFLQVLSRTQGHLRVYERGTGEILASGTGAAAAMVYGRLQGWFDSRVEMQLPGGILHLEWLGEGHSVKLTGPAQRVFEGQIYL